MSFNKYYQDELAYLRDMGREFAERFPKRGGHLAEAGTDPDVERLLEGFAFLTGRVRQKLDDELPEFTHAMLELFWPHYLRPLPSFTVVQFESTSKALDKVIAVPRDTELAAKELDGTSCRFRTTSAIDAVPLSVSGLEVGPSNSPYVRLAIKPKKPGALKKLKLERLRLYLAGEAAASTNLRLCLLRYTKRVVLRAPSLTEDVVLDARVTPAGLTPQDALFPLPTVSFPGFRLLFEYFAFPEKFSFVDVEGLGPLESVGTAQEFELVFELSELPQDMPPLSEKNVLLNCVPAVNVFAHDGDPIRLDHTRTEYKLRPACRDASHYEPYSVEGVTGIRRGQSEHRTYSPLFSFKREEGGLFFRARRAPSQTLEGSDLFLSFVGHLKADDLDVSETISTRLLCTNRQLPRSLGLGAVCEHTSDSPRALQFKNVLAPTPSVPAPLAGDVYWSLISHLSLNYLSLADADRLRKLLRLYDFRALVDRQAARTLERKLGGIAGVRSERVTRVLKGAAVRGMKVVLDLDEERFGGEGEVHLFGDVLNQLLGQYVSLNAFSELEVRGQKFGEVHTWAPRSGERSIL
ncbi:MAG: type VI secretion system baseplate subunit TssF [Planctomycetes bacterium]|nr:type VI secretion system baseplate subunit TssF [Planctomycetota bacterium]